MSEIDVLEEIEEMDWAEFYSKGMDDDKLMDKLDEIIERINLLSKIAKELKKR